MGAGNWPLFLKL